MVKKYPPFTLGKYKPIGDGSKASKQALDALPGLVLTTSMAGVIGKIYP